jgi:hypothetical protein
MLFQVSYKGKPSGKEADDKRVLQVFSKWTPPAGIEIKCHYIRPDGGGFLVIEANSVTPLIEAIAPYATYLEYEVTPIADAGEAVPALGRAYAWRDTVR